MEAEAWKPDALFLLLNQENKGLDLKARSECIAEFHKQ